MNKHMLNMATSSLLLLLLVGMLVVPFSVGVTVIPNSDQNILSGTSQRPQIQKPRESRIKQNAERLNVEKLDVEKLETPPKLEDPELYGGLEQYPYDETVQ